MNAKNPMRTLRMGCGESLRQALPPVRQKPLLEQARKPLLPKADVKPNERKPR